VLVQVGQVETVIAITVDQDFIGFSRRSQLKAGHVAASLRNPGDDPSKDGGRRRLVVTACEESQRKEQSQGDRSELHSRSVPGPPVGRSMPAGTPPFHGFGFAGQRPGSFVTPLP
jgi:hypothetical protein